MGQYRVAGLPNNIAFLRAAAKHDLFQAGGVDTSFLAKHLGDILPSVGADADDGSDPVALARARPAAALASIARLLLAHARSEETQEASSGWSDLAWAQGDGHRPIGSPADASFSYSFGGEGDRAGAATVYVRRLGGRFVPGDDASFEVTVFDDENGSGTTSVVSRVKCEVEALPHQELDGSATSSISGPGVVRLTAEMADGKSINALVVALPLQGKAPAAQDFAVFCDSLPASAEDATAQVDALASFGGT